MVNVVETANLKRNLMNRIAFTVQQTLFNFGELKITRLKLTNEKSGKTVMICFLFFKCSCSHSPSSVHLQNWEIYAENREIHAKRTTHKNHKQLAMGSIML